MRFNCLIEILTEKDLCNVRKNTRDGLPLSIEVRSKYSAVIDKVEASLPEDVYKIRNSENHRFGITIMTAKDLSTFFHDRLSKTSGTSISIRYSWYFDYYERKLVHSFLTNTDEFDVKFDPIFDRHTIIDVQAEQELKIKKQKEIKEVEDFLNSLP